MPRLLKPMGHWMVCKGSSQQNVHDFVVEYLMQGFEAPSRMRGVRRNIQPFLGHAVPSAQSGGTWGCIASIPPGVCNVHLHPPPVARPSCLAMRGMAMWAWRIIALATASSWAEAYVHEWTRCPYPVRSLFQRHTPMWSIREVWRLNPSSFRTSEGIMYVEMPRMDIQSHRINVEKQFI